jgi:hypothetical protein
MNNGFESDREFREWQAAVAMQYGIQPAVVRSDGSNAIAKARSAKGKLASPKRRSTDKKVAAKLK